MIKGSSLSFKHETIILDNVIKTVKYTNDKFYFIGGDSNVERSLKLLYFLDLPLQG